MQPYEASNIVFSEMKWPTRAADTREMFILSHMAGL